MSDAEFDNNVTVSVDEALLAQIREEAARRAGGSDGDAGSDDAHEVAASADEVTQHVEAEVIESSHAEEFGEDVPTVEGYGALREIGRGGFSRVYEALQFEFQRWVAIKVLGDTLESDEEIASFERECRLMGVLSRHPNIVTVFASAFTAEQRPCIVMELFPHGSYVNVLQDTGPLGLEELLPLTVQLSGALATAHRQGMVHGDVKPQNIFRSEFGSAALGDFGIATLMHQRASVAKTRLSLYYAAPELIESGVSATSPFADQYSLAATAYTLATGLRPFASDTGDTTSQLLTRMVSEPVPRLGGDFPKSLDEALRRAMAREPQNRHRDMAAFASAIAEVEQELGFKPTEVPVARDTGRYVGQTPEPDWPRSTTRPRSRDSPLTPPTRTGDTSPTTASREHEEVVYSQTVVRPMTPVTAESPVPEPEDSQRKSRVPRWAKVGMAVAAVAAAAAVLLVVRSQLTDNGGDGTPGGGDNGDEAPELEGADGSGTGLVPPPDDDDPDESDDEQVVSTTTTTTTTVVVGPPGSVIGLSASGTTVRWSPPGDDGGSAVTGYTVAYSGSPVDVGGRTSYTIEGLPTGTHVVTVTARNREHSGPSASTEVTVVGPPGSVIGLSASGTTVRWSPPGDDGGSAVTGYGVTVRDGSSGWSIHPRNIGTRTSYSLPRNLHGSVEVKVTAHNSAGAGPEASTMVLIPYRLAFVSNIEGTDAIYFSEFLATEDGIEVLEAERVTNSQKEEGSPVWSPDGAWIAFQRRTEEGGYWQLFVKSMDDETELQLLCGTRNGWSPDWSPDGTRIVFARGTERENDLLYIDVRTLTDKEIKDKSGKTDRHPRWSPDGNHIAFVRGSYPSRQIWVLHLHSEDRNIDLVNIGDGDYSSPDWSPVTNTLAFAFRPSESDYRHIYTVDWSVDNPNIIDPELTLYNPRIVSVGNYHDDKPSWSPDGRWIAFSRGNEGSRRIHIVSSSGGESHELPAVLGYDYSEPSWSPSADVTVEPTRGC